MEMNMTEIQSKRKYELLLALTQECERTIIEILNPPKGFEDEASKAQKAVRAGSLVSRLHSEIKSALAISDTIRSASNGWPFLTEDLLESDMKMSDRTGFESDLTGSTLDRASAVSLMLWRYCHDKSQYDDNEFISVISDISGRVSEACTLVKLINPVTPQGALKSAA